MKNFIPVSEPRLEGNEKKYLLECIETGWISSEGPFVNKFETLFSSYVNRKFGIAVCNGTVAIELALVALGIEKDDEVIVPTFTIISCILAILRVGGKPILVDSDPLNWNMDITQIESKITKKTKAIMVVHIYGLPVEMDKVMAIAEKYGLKVIEDAAEMHGQTYHGKPCGSFGEVSIFSFYSNKLITTGEGGMILTDDEKLAEKCRSYRNLCFIKEKRFLHHELGYNFRMTNLQAAIGVAQFEKIEQFIERKRAIGKLYSDILQGESNIQIPVRMTPYAENIYWVFGVVLTEDYPFNAEYVMSKLAQLGIGTRPFFYPMHKQPVFQKMGLFHKEKLPVSEMLSAKGFYLPSGQMLTDVQIEEVTSALKAIL